MEAKPSLRQRAYYLLEREGPPDVLVSITHRALVVLILINVAACVLVTVPEISTAYGSIFEAIEYVSLGVFTAEYILRLWIAPESQIYIGKPEWFMRLKWIVSPAGLIDLVAILPFVAADLFDVDLRVVAMIRLLRFFKIARYSPGFSSLVEAVRAERHALVACLIILASVILISAGLLYVLEHEVQADKFGSIPDAMWWAVATVTTVGYGDVVPVTVMGRIVGAITMVTGLLMLALPAGIVATAFANIIARHNFVLTAGLVARMPIFAGVDAGVIINLLPAIATRSFDRGEYILRRGEVATSLYLISEGEVEAVIGRQHRRLKPGDAFGGSPQTSRRTIRAATQVKLLVLEPREVELLSATFPQVAKRISDLEAPPPPAPSPRTDG